MKIAVPTRANRIDDHFGHCESYTVFTVDDKEIIFEETLKSPEGCGCKSNIASVLQKTGVEVMLAGNMGMGALNVLNMHGIDVIRGCSGHPKEVAELFLKGELTDSGTGCGGHEGHVDCHNH